MSDRTSDGVHADRWHPRRYRPRSPASDNDPAALALSHVAQSILGRLPHVLQEVRQASQTSVCRCDYAEAGGGEDRAWRFTVQSREAYCILREDDERTLLRLIVGAAPRSRLSSIERRITSEAVCQLLTSSGTPATLAEVARERPGAPTWHCSIDVAASGTPSWSLEFFMPCSPPAVERVRRPDIGGVVLPLRAVLSSGGCDIASVMQWRPGSLVRLQWGLDVAPFIFAGGRRIAQGQLGSLRGGRALMLTAVWTRT